MGLSIPSFPDPYPYPMGSRKGWHLCLSICASFFRETGAEWDFPAVLYTFAELNLRRTGNILELGSLCITRENLGTIGDIDGVNCNDGICVTLKEQAPPSSFKLGIT